MKSTLGIRFNLPTRRLYQTSRVTFNYLASNVRYCARYTAAADVQSASDDFDEWEIKLKGLNKGSTLCHLYDLSGLTDASIIMHLALLIAGVATSPLFKIIKADA